jgi:PilZ domain-containing protein
MERRSVARTKVDGSASILPAGQFKLLSCDLLDLTNRGARLDIGALARQLGDPFDFSFDSFRTIRPARLAWCHGSIAGIEFISPQR